MLPLIWSKLKAFFPPIIVVLYFFFFFLEMDMIAELQKLSALEKQMEKWGKDIESELTISQRISEKTVQDKNKLIEEKRKMVFRQKEKLFPRIFFAASSTHLQKKKKKINV